MTKKEYLEQQYANKCDYYGEKLNLGDEVALFWGGAQLRKGTIIKFCRKVVIVEVKTPNYTCHMQKLPKLLIKINCGQ